jgi:Hydroxyacylglutathione hydrolase C-terminus
MRVDVCISSDRLSRQATDHQQDPEIQKATGKTDPVEVMAKLREMKNNFK